MYRYGVYPHLACILPTCCSAGTNVMCQLSSGNVLVFTVFISLHGDTVSPVLYVTKIHHSTFYSHSFNYYFLLVYYYKFDLFISFY